VEKWKDERGGTAGDRPAWRVDDEQRGPKCRNFTNRCKVRDSEHEGDEDAATVAGKSLG